MRRASVIVWGVVLLVAVRGLAQQDNIYFLGKERPQRAVVTSGVTLPAEEFIARGMWGELHGVLADLRGQELGKLFATPTPRSKLVDARGDLERLGVVHLVGRESTKRVELYWGNEGKFVAQEIDAEGAPVRAAELDAERARAVMLGWATYEGGFGAKVSGAVTTGETFELAKPYVQAPYFMDQVSLGERFLRGRVTDIPATTRVLGDETMRVRLPRGYDTRRPAGLLVWVNAGGDGRIPEACVPVLDELGLVAAGIDNIGNNRPLADRYQLALDAVWTVSRRYHIDAGRVYLSGISGGGAVVSMLGPCFPEHFAGTVPIVGIRAYFNVPVGNGKFVRAGYERPDMKRCSLAKKRRLAGITGDLDGNSIVVREAIKRMAQDGMNARVFDFPELGHQMPTPVQFAQALKWVDEPRAGEIETGAAEAKEALEKYVRKFGRVRPADERQRRELLRVMELGPWSDAAWDAVELVRRGADAAP